MPALLRAVLATTLSLTWTIQPSGTTASLRGVCAVSGTVAWASGSGGTFLRTTDGGAAWRMGTVPGDELDFRGVVAFSDKIALLMSAGPGAQSRIYRTLDGGSNWALALTDPDAKGFFDALAFWDIKHGLLIGDPVNGRFAVFSTSNGGKTWRRETGPAALDGEGAFAASNTSLALAQTKAHSEAWFGTGGPGATRVFHSSDSGRTWTAAATPIRNDAASAGIFSLAFADAQRGVAVGGDYAKPGEDQHDVALTDDGGRTWREPKGTRPRGFRSAVTYVRDRKVWITVGTSGSDVSYDGGENWTPIDVGNYNAVSCTSSQFCWAVGSKGRLAKLQLGSK